MRITLTFLAVLLLGSNLGTAEHQNSSDSCGFVLEGESSHPTVTGPDELVPLVHVVEQPDSPIEILSVDLTGMWLSISLERTTEHFCAKYRVRNRGNQTVQEFGITLMVSTIAGAGGGSGTIGSLLAPGQTIDVDSCGGRGDGSAEDNYVRLLVYVNKVDFEDCHYKPSLRIPRSLKVHTVW